MLKKVIFNILFILIIVIFDIAFLTKIFLITEDNKIKNNDLKKYYMTININSINLHKELYEYGSKYNSISYGIEILKSDLPDKKNGNFILASHRGTSNVAYFDKLDNMKYGDIIEINYQNKKYKYIYTYKYEILKTGYAYIKQDKTKNQITLITCKKHDKNKQVIYIGYIN